MGGSTEIGGMWPEQAPAELYAKDAGRPTLLASDVAFIPLHVQPSLEGYSGGDDIDDLAEPPALFTIRVVVAGKVRTHRLRWRRGLQLKQYLREAGLIGARMRLALNIDGRKRVSMSYIPSCGESLNMVPPQLPLFQLKDA